MFPNLNLTPIRLMIFLTKIFWTFVVSRIGELLNVSIRVMCPSIEYCPKMSPQVLLYLDHTYSVWTGWDRRLSTLNSRLAGWVWWALVFLQTSVLINNHGSVAHKIRLATQNAMLSSRISPQRSVYLLLVVVRLQ